MIKKLTTVAVALTALNTSSDQYLNPVSMDYRHFEYHVTGKIIGPLSPGKTDYRLHLKEEENGIFIAHESELDGMDYIEVATFLSRRGDRAIEWAEAYAEK